MTKLYRLIGNGHEGSYKKFLNALGKSDAVFSLEEYRLLMNQYYGHCPCDITDGTGWYVISKELNIGGTICPEKVEEIDKSGLFIAAPSDDFNLKGLSKKSKHGYFRVFETKVKDPIVFRYVRGGIQVITKWGLEANDQSLVVPILN